MCELILEHSTFFPTFFHFYGKPEQPHFMVELRGPNFKESILYRNHPYPCPSAEQRSKINKCRNLMTVIPARVTRVTSTDHLVPSVSYPSFYLSAKKIKY